MCIRDRISTCIMGANYTNDPVWIMVLMAVAFFGNGFASITWSLVSSLAPVSYTHLDVYKRQGKTPA